MNHRKQKRELRKAREKDTQDIRLLYTDLRQKGYFEDCNFEVAKITELDTNSSRWCDTYVEGMTLLKRSGTSCSLKHCNPLPLTKAEALERTTYQTEHGRLAYLKEYVYSPMTAEQEAGLIAHYKEHGWDI